MPREWAAAYRNMSQILGHTDASRAHAATRSLFRHFSYYFADLLSLNRAPLSRQQQYLAEVYGFDHLTEILDAGIGFVAATAHLGNWELAGRLLSPFGKTVNVLRTPERNPAVQKMLQEVDGTGGLRFVSNTHPADFVKLLVALRRGEVVAVQIDRATGHPSDRSINFFGAPARFPSGPFFLAAAAKVPVIPFFCLMRPDHRYEMHIGEPIRVARGQEDDGLQQLIHVVEQYVARAPDQWFNFYDVWTSTSQSA